MQVIQDRTGLDAGQSHLCGDDLDILLCAQKPGCAHGNSAEECHQSLHHCGRLPSIWEGAYPPLLLVWRIIQIQLGEWASLTLLCMSALCGFIADLAFDVEECLWRQLEYLLSTLKVKSCRFLQVHVADL